jgi:uncharacterized protein YdhG (YjbR/CyaY superfamily)
MSIIDEFLKLTPTAQRAELERIRTIIKRVCPDAEEVITYAMPGFKYRSKYLVAFASFNDHMSLFPGALAIDQLKDELRGFKCSKGTIQFTLENPLPEKLVEEITRLNIQRIDDSLR